jgi:hypothetical protein
VSNISSTKTTLVKNVGYVAKLNQDKTRIVSVYLDRKTAAMMNGNSPSCLDTPMKNGTQLNGYYYMLYNSCPINIKSTINDGREPLLYKSGVGQFNANNQLIREFSCKYDCLRQLLMSDKTLFKALDKNVLYNDTYFRSLGEKLSLTSES